MAGFHCIKFKVSKYENEIEILKKISLLSYLRVKQTYCVERVSVSDGGGPRVHYFTLLVTQVILLFSG